MDDFLTIKIEIPENFKLDLNESDDEDYELQFEIIKDNETSLDQNNCDKLQKEAKIQSGRQKRRATSPVCAENSQKSSKNKKILNSNQNSIESNNYAGIIPSNKELSASDQQQLQINKEPTKYRHNREIERLKVFGATSNYFIDVSQLTDGRESRRSRRSTFTTTDAVNGSDKLRSPSSETNLSISEEIEACKASEKVNENSKKIQKTLNASEVSQESAESLDQDLTELDEQSLIVTQFLQASESLFSNSADFAKFLSNSDKFSEHLTVGDLNSQNSSIYLLQKSNQSAQSCPLCFKMMSTNLDQHFLDAHPNEFNRCKFCDKQFMNWPNCKSHMIKRHAAQYNKWKWKKATTCYRE